jgi:hypothetical protein
LFRVAEGGTLHAVHAARNPNFPAKRAARPDAAPGPADYQDFKSSLVLIAPSLPEE